jgi:hypothetical protein
MYPTLRVRIGGRISLMRFRAAFALSVALAVPTWAQHPGGQGGGISGQHGGGGGHAVGGAHAGGGGYGGAVHGGAPRYGGARGGYSRGTGAPSYSGLVGIQQPSSFSAPGRFPMPSRLQPPPRAGAIVNRGNGFSGGYAPGPDHGGRNPHRGPYRGHTRDRHRGGWGSYGYAPAYGYAYPYVVDPGFYEWGATDYSGDEQGSYASAPPDQGPGYGAEPPYPANGDAPYSQQQEGVQPEPNGIAPPQRQEYHFGTAAPSASTPFASKPLTVIFKGGRAPEKMQNYMVTSTALTNLDGEHFEKIPLDRIDVAATQEANRSSGIDFQVPVASHD